MKCPKCGRKLIMVTSDKDNYIYSHTYTLGRITKGSVCDYSATIKRIEESK